MLEFAEKDWYYQSDSEVGSIKIKTVLKEGMTSLKHNGYSTTQMHYENNFPSISKRKTDKQCKITRKAQTMR
ncbi:hypothetical protein E5288_WYG018680 [Bos mutus]|uniref:Uncharacterized protein n=1 Tax=Bos mutus TaxID=72004 RepID=A0A6B0QZ86_9CETA|nr:hypothetical protein [Bos mutus]